jgi:purine-binding chemotaxis protein CheW
MADYVKPVVFKIDGQLFGIDISVVQSIEKQISIVPVPNATPYIKGIVNLRGEVIPVYSLKRKFNMKDESYTDSSIIIETNSVKIALEVDEVMEIGEIGDDSVVKMPFIIKNDDTKFMTKVVHSGKNLIIIIDTEQLLTEQEAENLKQMTEEMQG